MPHTPRWRCIFGHRWERVDTHVYEFGRGYETATMFATCARCGFVGAWSDTPMPASEGWQRGGPAPPEGNASE